MADQQKPTVNELGSVAKNSGTRLLLERDLREVCAAKGFHVAYQPQIDLQTERVVTFEALIRWHHPDRGDVSPAEFIGLAEEIGLIGEIGQWMLEQACRDAVNWPEDINLAVNVSPLQLKDTALPGAVSAALAAAGLSPSRLELEVTETCAIPNDDIALAVLHKIKCTGVGIVMDDFDIGYSALGRIIKFPFSKIKFDRSFVYKISRGEPRREVAISVIRSIIELCQKLDIICLAEGVETKEQLEILRQINCNSIQGYLLGKPASYREIFEVIKNIPEYLRGIKTEGNTIDFIPDQRQRSSIPFFQIAETANDIILVTTADLDPPGPVITYVNPAFTKLTGYDFNEVIGLSPRILQGPGTSRETLKNITKRLKAGKSVHEKILNFGKSGAPYWLDMHIVPLFDNAGKITQFAAIERDVTLDKRRLDELEHLADRDTLTGIPNRRAFLRELRAECSTFRLPTRAASKLTGPCLVFIDIDHFKRVNDEHGHPVGDAVLCGIADRLSENIRRLDIVGRLGGEEFAVCMPAVALQDAKALAERLRRAVAGAAFDTPAGPISITVSLGVACYRNGDSVSTLIERADAAMYVAKRTGRNRVRAESTRLDERELIKPEPARM